MVTVHWSLRSEGVKLSSELTVYQNLRADDKIYLKKGRLKKNAVAVYFLKFRNLRQKFWLAGVLENEPVCAYNGKTILSVSNLMQTVRLWLHRCDLLTYSTFWPTPQCRASQSNDPAAGSVHQRHIMSQAAASNGHYWHHPRTGKNKFCYCPEPVAWGVNTHMPRYFFHTIIIIPWCKKPSRSCKQWPPPKINRGEHLANSSLCEGWPPLEVHVGRMPKRHSAKPD